MPFEKFFRFTSYLAVVCGFFSLWVSGAVGVVGSISFIAVAFAAWFLEDTKWRISERIGTALIVLTLPLFYWLWKLQFFGFANAESLLPGILARLILTLTAIKLLQKKSDRDWIFLYLMAFFEVLLAAGLSISALYLASFLAFLLVMVCTILAFEIRKTARNASEKLSRRKIEIPARFADRLAVLNYAKLPVVGLILIIGIAAVATPLFFALPRVGGAGLGTNRSGGISTSTGFSDTVRLGGVGRIQQNDEVVMRIRVENYDPRTGPLYWRGIALDTFDNVSWSKSRPGSRQPFSKDDRDLIQFDNATRREDLVTQTVYLEPLDTNVLFGLPRIIGAQGNFSVLYRDLDGAITFPRSGERTSYKLASDRTLPPVDRLRADNGVYPVDANSYLQLPEHYDVRIDALAAKLTENYSNRYDKAKAIEGYLQNNFGYSLDLKAGGREPLADFLFNVREGHCEYFATAMAVMLRTQGIATRVVNGFQQGDYNETADVYVVRQMHAHSWVEVYFPKERAWVSFDPTPAAGHTSGSYAGGIFERLSGYMEALETFWIQYFVAFDNQEQQSMVRSARRSFVDFQAETSGWLNAFQTTFSELWAEVRGDRGLQNSVVAIAYIAAGIAGLVFIVFLTIWAARKIVKLEVWQRLTGRFRGSRASIVEFYERMEAVLAGKGIVRSPHQTPLEFAFASGYPEAVKIAEKYNGVRFGERSLHHDEAAEIDAWLENLEAMNDPKNTN
jgi:transglutaminase-like putative cysteine protease